MKRNSFLAGLFTAAALVFSAPSFAHGYFYTDYFDQTMHPPKDSGVYLGLHLGYTVNHWDDLEGINDIPSIIETVKVDEDNLGVRAFIGYMFNKFWALELGYAQFDDTKITITEPPVMMGDPDIVTFDERSGVSLVDLLLRISVPLSNNFSVFTKIGFAYIKTDDAPQFQEVDIIRDDRTNFDLAFGAGFLYRISKHWSADLSWLHYHGNSEIGKNFQPDIDFISLALALIFPT